MKKILLLIAILLGAMSANAQFAKMKQDFSLNHTDFKDSGLKIIGELGVGVDWCSIKYFGTAFGLIAPDLDISLGTHVLPQLFVGGGLGYNVLCGVSDLSGGTGHELKLFAHGRYYFSPAGQSAIVDLKLGYKRNFSGESNAFDLFIGPGYMFNNKYAVALGYSGSFYNDSSLHGIAAKFSVEF